MNPDDIPPPFDNLHTEVVTNRASIFAALEKRGILPKLQAQPELPVSTPAISKEPAFETTGRRPSRRDLVIIGGVLGAGALGFWALTRNGVVPVEVQPRSPAPRPQVAAVKIGVLHPVSGALSYSGQQGRIGAQLAIDEINAAGGIKALRGAKIEAILGDAQSTPDGGNAEVEKMNTAGVAAIVGGYASGICLAASQTAARYDLPYIVDVGVVDSIVTRGLKNTFRFGPGFGVIAKTALDNLVTINDRANKAAKTVMIVHEDSAFGGGLAKLLQGQLPQRGFQILETIAHPTPTRDFNNVVLKIKAQNPDLVIPANYYNEYVLLARTMQQQRVRPKGIYSVLGGAASSYKFVNEFPEAAQYVMDCNHWFDPKSPKALALKKKVEDKGEFYTYEVYMNYSCMLVLADALERAATTERLEIIGALESSTFSGHVMPYGPTKFVNGQNLGAAPVNTQVLDKDIQVIFPTVFASAKAVFPMPA